MTVGEHLPDETLMDVVEGVASVEARGHAESCAECAARVEAARSGWSLARGADVPEPSPLYWASFGRQVDGRLQACGARWRPAVWVPTLAAAAAVLVAVSFLPLSNPPSSPVAAPLPAWSPLPPADEDSGLALLDELGPTAEDLGPAGECRGLTDCLTELSEEEGLALAEALREELQAERDL